MRRPWMFVLGVAVVVGSVVGPLERLTTLHFPAHMIQHMILVLVAGPLIAGSHIVDPRGRFLRSVLVVGIAHAGALWVWHLPAAYDAAMESAPLHMLEHASFLVSAVLFWIVVLDKAIHRFKRLFLVFGTMLQSGALGALIVFASAPLYEWHEENTPAGPLGSSMAVSEQQTAGAIMWVPPGFVYLTVMIALLARALSTREEREYR